MKIKQTLVTAVSAVAVFAAAQGIAAEVKTAGAAIDVCKEQAKTAHPDYKSSKVAKIKQRQGVFKIKLRIRSESEKVMALCEVSRDGEVKYEKI